MRPIHLNGAQANVRRFTTALRPLFTNLVPISVRASFCSASAQLYRDSPVFDVQSQPLKIATAQWIVQSLKKNR